MTNSERINSNNALIDQAIAKATALPNAGSGGGGSVGASVEYETVELTSNSTSIPFTLKRITATYGMISQLGTTTSGQRNTGHFNTRAVSGVSAGMSTSCFVRELTFSNGALSSSTEFIAPYTAVFVNDPNAPAIYEET